MKQIWKRTLSILLGMIVVIGLLPTTAFALPTENWGTGDGWTAHCTADGKMTFTRSDGAGTTIKLNDYYYQENPVFSEKIRPMEVIFPEGVETIWAKKSQYLVERVSLPSTLITLGEKALHQNNMTSVSLPSGLRTIGYMAMAQSFLLTSISVPSGVREIGMFAFENSPQLVSVTLPDTVESFDKGAFRFCSQLSSVKLPSNLTVIPDSTFHSCSSLTTIDIPDSVTLIEDCAFEYAGITSVRFPEGLICIDHRAFIGTPLTSIELPDGLEAIGNHAFSGTNLTEVTIPASVTYIGYSAFPSGEQFTVYGYRGTQAQWFAQSNGNTFVPLDDCGIDVEIKPDDLVYGTVKAGTVTEIVDRPINGQINPIATLIADNDSFHNVSLTVHLPEGFSFEPNKLVTKKEIETVFSLTKDEELRVDIPTIYPIYLGNLNKTDCYDLRIEIRALDSVEAEVHGTQKCGFFQPEEVSNTATSNGAEIIGETYTFDLNSATGSGTRYNQDTATLAALLADGAYNQEGTTQFLSDLGFTSIYGGCLGQGNVENCGYYIADKTIIKDGQIKHLIYVICRGTILTRTLGEWRGNFNVGFGLQHNGFYNAALTIQRSLSAYCEQAGYTSGDTLFLVTGHSKGAAAANLLGNWLTNQSELADKESISIYTFATPTVDKTLTTEEAGLNGNENSFNFVNYQDAIRNAPSMAHFGRYGHVYIFGVESAPSGATTHTDAYSSYPALGLTGENYTVNEVINGLLYQVNTSTDLNLKIPLVTKVMVALMGSRNQAGHSAEDILNGLLRGHSMVTYYKAVRSGVCSGPSYDEVNGKTEQAVQFYQEKFLDTLIASGINLAAQPFHLFKCPVDIYVEDAQGSTVATSADGQLLSDNGHVMIYTLGDLKLVAVDARYEDLYTIRAEGYGDGTMTHCLFYTNEDGITQMQTRTGIPVQTGASETLSAEGYLGGMEQYQSTTDQTGISDTFTHLGAGILSGQNTDGTMTPLTPPSETPGTEGEEKTGLYQDEDGVWKYYVDGAVDTTFTGMVDYYGTLFYVANGTVDWNYVGLGFFNDTWYYISGGIQDGTYTGLAQYYDNWFYVADGVLDWGYTGLVDYYDTQFYVANGVVDWNYVGLGCYNDLWYYVDGGVVNWSYTGLAQYYDNWFYMANGELDWNFTGLVDYCGTQFYVAGGVVDWDYVGLGCFNGTWYFVRGGVVDWTYTGLADYWGNWFYVKDGLLDWSYTGFADYYGTEFYVVGGYVDWGFTGTVDGRQVVDGVVVG